MVPIQKQSEWKRTPDQHKDKIWSADTAEEETQEHLEICKGTVELRKKLYTEKEHNHVVFERYNKQWRIRRKHEKPVETDRQK